MNILCNERGFVGKFVYEGDLGLTRRRHCYEGALATMVSLKVKSFIRWFVEYNPCSCGPP